jgi:UDP-glucose 4-epimerase
MNIFISGGAGFIGSHLAKKMLTINGVDSIVIYDNFTSGTSKHIAGLINNSKVKLITGDIKDLDLLTHSMIATTHVFHLAANPDIAKAATQPNIDFWEGTYLTQNVLEAMRVNGVKNIFYTSGSGVYGDSPGTAFEESFGPMHPISTYGASKLGCEALICSYCYMFQMCGRAFRFANVVGPAQTHGVGYDFVRRLKANDEYLEILGDGTQTKSYVHIDDIVNAILLVMQASNVSALPFDAVNVATDDYVSVTEIADLTCKVLGYEKGQVTYKYTGGNRGWKGDVPKVLFDTSKIKSLGWSPNRNSFTALKDSITSMSTEIAGT